MKDRKPSNPEGDAASKVLLGKTAETARDGFSTAITLVAGEKAAEDAVREEHAQDAQQQQGDAPSVSDDREKPVTAAELKEGMEVKNEQDAGPSAERLTALKAVAAEEEKDETEALDQSDEASKTSAATLTPPPPQ